MLKLWKHSIFRLKTAYKNYNVLEKAEKVLENEKRAAPKHPGTEVKFQVLVKGNPEIRKELEKKDPELLNRLKVVKVNSDTYEEEPQVRGRPLPQERQRLGIPTFGFPEPSIIPEGKCTLRQVLEFLEKHQNDPQTHTIEAIAKTYSLKTEDVYNIIKYFKAFALFVSRDSKKDVDQTVLDSFGVTKVTKQLFHPKFSHLEENINAATIDESKEVGGEKKK